MLPAVLSAMTDTSPKAEIGERMRKPPGGSEEEIRTRVQQALARRFCPLPPEDFSYIWGHFLCCHSYWVFLASGLWGQGMLPSLLHSFMQDGPTVQNG